VTDPTVTSLHSHLSSITCPSSLADLPAWLMWRLEHHDGEAKARKVPYYTNGRRRHGTQGAPPDRQALTTFAAARAAAARKGFDGVGLALLPDWGITALDFDACITGGKLHPDVEAIAATSYAEYSPSGTGVHVLMQGLVGDQKSHARDGWPFGFESFSRKGFVTWTGNRLEIVDIMGNADTVAPITEQVVALVHQRFPTYSSAGATSHDDPVLGLTDDQIEQALAVLDPDLPHDQWLAVGMSVHHETRGAGFDAWADWSGLGSKFPGRDILQQRWDSFGKQTGKTVTGRTLLKMANAAGARISPSPVSPEDFEVQVAQAGEPGKALRFAFTPVHQFASAQGLPWVIKGVLPKAALAVVYGASGSGKSFAVLDMALSIARGIDWRGRKVRQGRVAYVAAEGADGFRKRLSAYAQQHEVDLAEVPMAVLDGAPNLMLVDDTADLAVGVLAAGEPSLVIVDTLAQTTPGANENAGEDMGKALGHCRRLHEMTGATVLLIHHSGKDQAKGARGWSGLRAACDAEIEVIRSETGARELRLSKAKDGEDGLRWGFKLDVVQVGVDEDGDPITSCVVAEAELASAQLMRVLGPVEEVVNAVIQGMAGAQTSGIEVGAVIAEAVRQMPEPADGKRDTRRMRARRALESLCAGDAAPYWLGDDGCISIV
jgi:AAA domain/Primase C terminal 2 (PriCT-2)